MENIGSGVVLDPRGIIVTNEDLIAKAITIRVKFVGGKEYDAYVLASDPEFDIALLKIISNNVEFPYLTVGKKRTVLVGERAIVIGNPYGVVEFGDGRCCERYGEKPKNRQQNLRQPYPDGCCHQSGK